MIDFWDRKGRPLTMDQYAEHMEDPEYRRIAFDEAEHASVSTIWLGLDPMGRTPPLIFETMISGGPLDGMMFRWETEDEARQKHALIWFLAGAPPATTQ